MPHQPPHQSDSDAPDRIDLPEAGLTLAVEQDLTRPVTGPGDHAPLWADDPVDTVITDAVIVDYWGIVRADIGIRDGRVAGIGKAGVDMLVAPGTSVIAAAGRIVTAGFLDIQPRRLAAEMVFEALAAGVTTMVCEADDPRSAIAAAVDFPVNLMIAVSGAGSAAMTAGRLRDGAGALTLDAAPIDRGLQAAETFDVQALIAGDTRPFPVPDDIGAHTAHVLLDSRAGGIESFADRLNLLLSATGGEEPADLLHDIGAISIMRAARPAGLPAALWRTARRMKAARGALPEDDGSGHDNFRIKRYLAKATINPAIAHGLDEWTGAVGNGLLADLVLWHPTTFGLRADLVIKGGVPISGDDTAAPAVTFVAQATLSGKETIDTARRLLPVNHTRGITRESMIHNAATPAIERAPGTGVIRIDGATIEPA